MKKCVFILIAMMSVWLCVPGPGFSKMSAMTDYELGHLTGQRGIAPMPGGVALPLNTAAAMSSEWTGMAGDLGNGAAAICQLAGNGFLPLDMPLQLEAFLTDEAGQSLTLSSVLLTAGAAGLMNPLIYGFFGLGAIPGAFDVSMGNVSIELSGTLEFSVHP